jgi:hypothetical protein
MQRFPQQKKKTSNQRKRAQHKTSQTSFQKIKNKNLFEIFTHSRMGK